MVEERKQRVVGHSNEVRRSSPRRVRSSSYKCEDHENNAFGDLRDFYSHQKISKQGSKLVTEYTNSKSKSSTLESMSVVQNKKIDKKCISDTSETKSDEKDLETRLQKTEDKANSKMILYHVSEQILHSITIILHDDNLYYYTGRSYEIIKDSDELLRLVRSRVSQDAFGSVTIRKFLDLFLFMKADSRLVPQHYERRLKEAKYLVVFRNGVLNLKTMKLMEHSENYLTFYELNAKWVQDPCAREFERFLCSTGKNNFEIKKRIIEAMGYLLSPVNQGKYFFVMGTAPNSGKSTIGMLLTRLIGNKYVSSLPPYQLGEKFSLGGIHGKILNLSMDLPKGKLRPVTVSVIKQITGGDRIVTEQKYEKIREIHSDMRFLFASNYPVTISRDDDDDSFWNRMVVIPFLYSVDKKFEDTELLEKLMQEKDDIISICLKELHTVLERGCVFSECKPADELKYEWRYRERDIADTVQPFVEKYLRVTADPDDDIATKELFQKYSEYCDDNGMEKKTYIQFVKWMDNNMAGCFRKRIHHSARDNAKSGYSGVVWKNASSTDKSFGKSDKEEQ